MKKSLKMSSFVRTAMSLTLCASMLSVLAIAGNAKNENAEARWGTPVVDGKLDAAYLRSASTASRLSFHCPWDNTGAEAPKKEQATATGTSYFLWSEDYFYTCTVVKDDNIFKRDPSYYTTAYPWQDDGIEGYYGFGRQSFTLHNDAYGVVMYAYAGTSNGGLNAFCDVPAIGEKFSEPALSNIECKSKYATTVTADSFIIETALKLKDDAQFKAGDVMKFGLQINDLEDAEGIRGYAIGSQDCYNSGVNLTFAEKTDDDIAACVVAPGTSDTPTAEAPTGGNVTGGENVQGGNTAGGSSNQTAGTANGTVQTSNPGTSDAGIVAAAAVVLSAAAFAVISKKRR